MPISAENAARVTSDLALRLEGREREITDPLDYYRGKSGRLKFASGEFAQFFEQRFKGFSDNWCGPVVQSCAERMKPRGVRLDDSTRSADAELQRVWQANEAERGFSEAAVVMLAAARSHVLVWGDPDDEETPHITWEHPEQTIVTYDPGTRARRYGLKVWSDADEGKDYATLYTAEQVWKWQRNRAYNRLDLPESVDLSTGGWVPRENTGDNTWPLRNPMGVVPLVEMRNQTLLDDKPISDLTGVMAMQDAVNLVWAYLMNALDYASMPQRIMLGAEMPKVPILDTEGQPTGQYRFIDLNELIKERILWVPGDGVQATEWTAANLDAYGSVIEKGVEHIAAQTRTPPHYLVAKMVNTAAESLNIAEAGLVSKTQERITYVTPTMRELYRLVALAQGDEGKAEAVRSGTILWGDVQYRSEAQRADALSKKRQMGYPLEYILELDGVDPVDIPRIVAMAEKEGRDRQLDELARDLVPQGGPPEIDQQDF